MNVDSGHVAAVIRKEVREYRRNRFILLTMAILPVVFTAIPVSNTFRVSASATTTTVRALVGSNLLLVLLTAVILPATIAAYSVIGERDQGTLEPVLTTPVRREELVMGKALAAIVPAVAVSYLLFAILAIAVRFGATQKVVDAFWQPAPFIAEALFAPLLATFAIWVGMAISARASDVRVAQQLSTLASLPPLAVIALMQYQVIPLTVGVAVAIGAGFAIVDTAAWRVVTGLFDPERLITGFGQTRP